MKDFKLNVPYYSQFNDIDDKYWIPRACVPVCLKMILDFHRVESPPLQELIKIADKKGGFGPSGWYHNVIVDLAKEYGLDAHREEKMDFDEGLKKIVNYLEEENPIIVSTPKFILEQKKFHTVVLIGFKREGGKIKGLYFNDPESTGLRGGQNLFVSLDTFKKEWRRMAIFISK